MAVCRRLVELTKDGDVLAAADLGDLEFGQKAKFNSGEVGGVCGSGV